MKLAIIIFIIYILVYSPLLQINKIDTRGNNEVSEEYIISTIEQIKHTKRWLIIPQNHIIFFDESTLSKTLMQDLRIADIEIARRPRATLIVTITERPLAGFWQGHSHWFTLNEDGHLMSETTMPKNASESPSVILTNTNLIDDPKVGEEVVSVDTLKLIKEIKARVFNQIGINIINFDLSNIAEGKIGSKTDNGLTIYWSPILDTATQLHKLEIFVLNKAKDNPKWAQSISYIDLRFGNSRIYYQ